MSCGGYSGRADRCDYCKCPHDGPETCGVAAQREQDRRLRNLEQRAAGGERIKKEDIDWATLPTRRW